MPVTIGRNGVRYVPTKLTNTKENIMRKFVKLTVSVDNLPIFIDADVIRLLAVDDDNDTVVLFELGGDKEKVHVKEDIGEVMKRIDYVNEGVKCDS